MRIGIIGVGNVGHALGDYLAEDNKVIGIDDLDIQASFPVYKDYSMLALCDAVFVCLPSPFDGETNSLDNSLIAQSVREIVKHNAFAPIFIKSTVNVGFTRKLANDLRIDRLYYTPEFLRQSSNSKKCFAMKYEEAEAVKLFANTYLATRIAFFNELDTYSELNGLDSKKIIKAVSADKRIGDYYNKPSYGYGGYCLPKDTMELMNEYKAPQKLIEATIQSNEVRKDHIVNCIVEKLKGVKEPIVGIYGLPGKYSALLDIINRLKGKNVRMLIYSNNHDMKSFDGVEVTDQFGRFIVDSSLVLSEQELPVEFKNSDKIYLK